MQQEPLFNDDIIAKFKNSIGDKIPAAGLREFDDALHTLAQKNQATLVLAVGPTGQCPTPLPNTWTGWGAEQPAAWALDAQSAGFFISNVTTRQLEQFTTSDGGRTWNSSPVLTNMSGERPVELIPQKLSQCGQRIALLASQESAYAGVGSGTSTMRAAMLHSSDVGHSWSNFGYVTKAQGMTGLAELGGNGSSSMHMMSGKTLYVSTRIEWGVTIGDFARAILSSGKLVQGTKMPQMTVPILITEDEGQSWRDYHALDSMISQPSQSFPMAVMGGDQDSVHVVVPATDGLLIRSFTSGDWLPPTTPLPFWFKEKGTDKLPEPTKEEF